MKRKKIWQILGFIIETALMGASAIGLAALNDAMNGNLWNEFKAFIGLL